MAHAQVTVYDFDFAARFLKNPMRADGYAHTAVCTFFLIVL